MFLLGNFQHTLDDKNRIRLPSKLRDQMGDKYVVMPGLNGCIAVYPAEGKTAASVAGHGQFRPRPSRVAA